MSFIVSRFTSSISLRSIVQHCHVFRPYLQSATMCKLQSQTASQAEETLSKNISDDHSKTLNVKADINKVGSPSPSPLTQENKELIISDEKIQMMANKTGMCAVP